MSLWRISSETINFFESFNFASGEISIGSTPPITTACKSELIISCVVNPVALGSESTAHAVAISTLAAASLTNRLPGKEFGIAPAAIAPRSPARRGTQPNFAPLSLTNFATAERAPWVSEARSPTNTTDLPVKPVIEFIAATSFPGAVLTKLAFNFSLPLLASDAIEVTLIARL